MSNAENVMKMVNEIIEKGESSNRGEAFVVEQLNHFKNMLISLQYSEEDIRKFEEIARSKGYELNRKSEKSNESSTKSNVIVSSGSCGGNRGRGRC